MDPFPFVVGSGRSGTTLLRAMLDSHPDLAIPPESHFVPRLARRAVRFERGGGLEVGELLDFLESSRRFAAWGLDREELGDALRSPAVRDTADALRAVYGVYAGHRGKRRFGDKTPDYIAHVEELAAFLPEVRFVHLVRDARDVTLSMMEREFGPASAVSGALNWKRKVLQGRRAAAALGPGRYLEVRYEDLVAEPERGLGVVCRFLDLPFAPEMLRYFERADELLRPLNRIDHEGLLRRPTSGLRDWRSQMPPEDAWVFEVLTGELLEELGYEVGHDSVGDGPSPLGADGGVRLLETVERHQEQLRSEIAKLEERMAALRAREDGERRRRAEAERGRAGRWWKRGGGRSGSRADPSNGSSPTERDPAAGRATGASIGGAPTERLVRQALDEAEALELRVTALRAEVARAGARVNAARAGREVAERRLKG